jgi:uncharacterized protein YoxC
MDTIQQQIADAKAHIAELEAIQRQAEAMAYNTERERQKREQAEAQEQARLACEQQFMAQFADVPATVQAANESYDQLIEQIEALHQQMQALIAQLAPHSNVYSKAVGALNEQFHRYDWRPITQDEAGLKQLYGRLFAGLFAGWKPKPSAHAPAPYGTSAEHQLRTSVNIGRIVERLAHLPKK